MKIIFDVFWFVEGVKHSYTFFDESDAEQFAKELEEKGYDWIKAEADPLEASMV